MVSLTDMPFEAIAKSLSFNDLQSLSFTNGLFHSHVPENDKADIKRMRMSALEISEKLTQMAEAAVYDDDGSNTNVLWYKLNWRRPFTMTTGLKGYTAMSSIPDPTILKIKQTLPEYHFNSDITPNVLSIRVIARDAGQDLRRTWHSDFDILLSDIRIYLADNTLKNKLAEQVFINWREVEKTVQLIE